MTYVCLATVILLPVLLNPIYASISSNILTKNSLWVDVLYYLRRIVEFLSYTLIFSLIIQNFYALSSNKKYSIVLIALGGSLVKYLVNFSVSALIEGFPRNMALANSIYNIIISTVFESIQILVVANVANNLIGKRKTIDKLKKKGASLSGKSADVTEYIPFSSLTNMKNPVLLSSLTAGGMISFFRVLSRLISDIAQGPAVDLKDLFWMIFYYSFDIVMGLIAYLIIAFLLLFYYSKENKPKA